MSIQWTCTELPSWEDGRLVAWGLPRPHNGGLACCEVWGYTAVLCCAVLCCPPAYRYSTEGTQAAPVCCGIGAPDSHCSQALMQVSCSQNMLCMTSRLCYRVGE